MNTTIASKISAIALSLVVTLAVMSGINVLAIQQHATLDVSAAQAPMMVAQADKSRG